MHLVIKVKLKSHLSIHFCFPPFPETELAEAALGFSSFLADGSDTDPVSSYKVLLRVPRGSAPFATKNSLFLFQYPPFPTSDLAGDNRVRNGHGTLKSFVRI